VIGKRGGTAQSIRTLLRALGTKNEARYNLKIVDSDGGSGATQSGPQSEAVDSDNAMLVNSEDSNPVEEDEAEVVENSSSEYEEKHRKDLADLDDLDI